jgi:hypothetical protein
MIRSRRHVLHMFRLAFTCLTMTVALAVGGCNSRTSVIDATVPTVPSGVVNPAPASTIVSLIVDPNAVFSGGGTSARVLLSFPAPAAGLGITLSSSDPAVTVPPSITVPAGADEAQFGIATREIGPEITATITASTGDRSVQAPLALWTRTSPFVASWSNQGNGQRTVAQRVTGSGVLAATCYTNLVSIIASQGASFYFLDFGAPPGAALQPGVYENAQTSSASPRSPSRPLLDIRSSVFFSCSAPQISRFIVGEAALASDGTVRRFTVTWEQQCGLASMRGEATLAGVPPTSTGTACIVR